MLIKAGFFDAAGNPCVEFELSGVFSQQGTKFNGIVDTGFTGFIAMPMIQAFPLGLPLSGTTNVTLANGATHAKLMAGCKAQLGSLTSVGLVILEPSSTDILVGMDFLRQFKAALFVSQIAVLLIEESAVQQFLAQQQQLAGAIPPTTSPPPPP